MILPLLMWLTNPISWMIALMLFAYAVRIFRGPRRGLSGPSHIVRVGSGGPEAIAAALMFLTTAYRPSVEFIAKTEIQQREEAEDDDQGGPDSPKRHLHRQLRRIRNGEHLDHLIWRLE